MKLKIPKLSFTVSDDELKCLVLSEYLISKDSSEAQLSKEETAINSLNRLSENINLLCIENFFTYEGACEHYYDIIDSLELVGDLKMKKFLEKIKQLVLGDLKVTMDNVENLDEDFREECCEKIEELSEREVEKGFEAILEQFTTKYFNEQGYELAEEGWERPKYKAPSRN